jgi:hypothetical protein
MDKMIMCRMIMYKILNKLFGWDYVYYYDGYFGRGFARIHTYPDGSVCFFDTWGRMTKLPSRKYDIRFLTCKPEKYIN